MKTALAPVVEALLADARDDAAKVVAAADADASARHARAQAEADAILAQARSDGEAAAAHAAAATLAEARRTAREVVLAAQRDVVEAVRRGALDALARRAASAALEPVFARLETMARTRLGGDAEVHRLVHDRIGVRASAGARVVELTTERLVEHELAALAERIAEVWR